MTKVLVSTPSRITVNNSGAETSNVTAAPGTVYPQVIEDEGLPTEDGLRTGDIYHDTLTGNLYRWED